MTDNPDAPEYTCESIPAMVREIQYSAYKSNRDEGMTHEQLISIGVGDSWMKVRYECGN